MEDVTYVPLILGATLCFLVLGLRFFAEAGRPKRRQPGWNNRIKLAKILVGAAMALYAISTTLHNLGDKIVVP
jgi:hypothetical protein